LKDEKLKTALIREQRSFISFIATGKHPLLPETRYTNQQVEHRCEAKKTSLKKSPRNVNGKYNNSVHKGKRERA